MEEDENDLEVPTQQRSTKTNTPTMKEKRRRNYQVKRNTKKRR